MASGFDIESGNSTVIPDDELQKVLSKEIGFLAENLLLIPQDGSSPNALPFSWAKAKEYYSEYCHFGSGNDCPDGEFDKDCTHFVAHGLSKSKVIVNLPTALCENGVCTLVAELAAAFKNSTGRYSNVKRIDDLSTTREGDFCFVVTFFGLSKDHVMVLSERMSASGGRVYGHTNNRCGEYVDLTGQSLVIYRIG